MEIKLKKEEEDRQARRKRVEAIMSRTRAKGGTPSVTPSKVRIKLASKFRSLIVPKYVESK